LLWIASRQSLSGHYEISGARIELPKAAVVTITQLNDFHN